MNRELHSLNARQYLIDNRHYLQITQLLIWKASEKVLLEAFGNNDVISVFESNQYTSKLECRLQGSLVQHILFLHWESNKLKDIRLDFQ